VARLARDAHLTKVETGHYRRLVGWGGDSMGKVAKACGVSEPVVQSWLAGESEPTLPQYLALTEALRPRRVAALNGSPG
jgi:hypothetical protein